MTRLLKSLKRRRGNHGELARMIQTNIHQRIGRTVSKTRAITMPDKRLPWFVWATPTDLAGTPAEHRFATRPEAAAKAAELAASGKATWARVCYIKDIYYLPGQFPNTDGYGPQ